MTNLLSAQNAESSRSRSRQRARSEMNEHKNIWGRLSLQKFSSWLKKDDGEHTPTPPSPVKPIDESNKENGRPHSSGGLLHRRSSRKVVPGLPRPLTFKRMNSEKRDKLLEVPVEAEQRRASSNERRPPTATKRDPSPPPVSLPSMSAPNVLSPPISEPQSVSTPVPVPEPLPLPAPEPVLEPSLKPPPEPERTIGGGPDSNIPAGARQVDYGTESSLDFLSAESDLSPPSLPPPLPAPGHDVEDTFSERPSHRSVSDIDDMKIQEELEAKWILNLSMHFRDMSDREKFFLTYAEEPNKWRRVTVSCDYRQLEPDSLEADLKTLHYQRDKSSRIYEAIRDSLPDIQFYDTVTNLKLQTTDGRLHVHVTEDVNEIIPYPSTSAITHLDCKRFTENAVSFDSHISGFVYKVAVNNRHFIKKEIPGPDAVEEFLYEINALCSLQESKSVIRFEGVIVDEHNEIIKGLLISYAEQGALVDMIYDFKPSDELPWERREKWARQIVEGLAEIHEAGFVQGDFTLSNIVIDRYDDAKIIDINRRGCPVGWEPPELAKLIESGQRISIYIGVKSDLYQLGMVLWALAEQEDEPERQERPLAKTMERHRSDIPSYFRDIVRTCLSDLPRNRTSASALLKKFPEPKYSTEFKPKVASRDSISTHRSDKEYIDPATAVDLNDISQHRRLSKDQSSYENINVTSTDYPESSGSYIMPNSNARSSSPNDTRSNSRYRRSDCSPYLGHRSVMSLDDSELENEPASLPISRDTRWEQIYIDGDTKLVQRGCGEIGVHDFAAPEPKEICITTPPDELESSFIASNSYEDQPLSYSALQPIEPIEPQPAPSTLRQPLEISHHRGVGNKASFSDRVHQLAEAQTKDSPPKTSPQINRHSAIPAPTVLAELEHEVDFSSSLSESTAPSRVNTGFSIFDLPDHPVRVGTDFSIAHGYRQFVHQDSGFGEPTRVSYESERIRHSLDESIRDANLFKEEQQVINERLWDEKDGTMFDESTREEQLQIKPTSAPVPVEILALDLEPQITKTPPMSPPIPSVGPTNVLFVDDVQDKGIEERNSNTTIRPPSILIPDFHHGLPKTFDSSSNGPITPPFSGSFHEHITMGKDPIQEYLEPTDTTPQSRDKSMDPKSDLDDYLSASISFSHHSEHFPLDDEYPHQQPPHFEKSVSQDTKVFDF